MKPPGCQGCILFDKGEGYVKGEGPKDPKLFLIGEAPGENEARTGLPFCGGAGRVLNALLAEARVFRNECYVTNIIKCRPPGNNLQPYLPAAAVHCRQYLDKELERHSTVNTVLLGDVALRFTLGRRSITKLRGCVYAWEGRRVIPTIHPAALMREAKNWSVVVADLMYAAIMHKQPPQINNFVIEPDLAEVRHFMAQVPKGVPTFCDIETYGPALACVGIAINENTAICIPLWNGSEWYWKTEEDSIEVAGVLREYLANPEYWKVFHNGMFDIDVLEKFGFVIDNWHSDTMLMHHTVYSEARHSLGFLHSVYVRGEYYKDMHHSAKEDIEE